MEEIPPTPDPLDFRALGHFRLLWKKNYMDLIDEASFAARQTPSREVRVASRNESHPSQLSSGQALIGDTAKGGATDRRSPKR
jgi:hypothetical protein